MKQHKPQPKQQPRKTAHGEHNRTIVGKEKGLELFLKKYPSLLYILLVFLVLVVFFNEALFKGRVFLVPDNISSLVYKTYVENARAQHINTFWNPYIFCGMPAWGSFTPGGEFGAPVPNMIVLKTWNGIQTVISTIFHLPESFWDIFNYFLMGLFTYIFLLNRKLDRAAALVGTLSFVFSTTIITWIMAGHNTKITVFMMLPLALYTIDKLFAQRKLIYVILLIITFLFQFNAGHIQMIFYSFLAVGLYLLFKFFNGHKWYNVLKVIAIVAVAVVVALCMLASTYLATYEYKPFSIRGAGSGWSEATGGGLDYNYATSWSFSPLEVFTFFIPSFVGFGKETYWGNMPFTEAPVYLGIVTLLLALFAIVWRRRDKFVLCFIILGLLALLLSFGKEFPLLYDLFFNYVPFFNNFRAPVMILCLLAFAVSILAGVGMNAIIEQVKLSGVTPPGRGHPAVGTKSRTAGLKSKPEMYSTLLKVLIGIGVIFVLFIIGQGALKSAYADMVASSHNQNVLAYQQAGQLTRFTEVVFGMMFKDLMKTMLFLLVGLGLIYAFLRAKLSATILKILFIALVMIDLWVVDVKPMEMKDRREQAQVLQPTDVVKFLQSDKSLYRILPLEDHVSPNWYIYFSIQNIEGYHPAKLKLYDDLLRRAIFPNNNLNINLLNFLNVKYLISKQPFNYPLFQPVFNGGQEKVYQNLGCLPRAFFVNEYKVIPDSKQMFELIKSNDYNPTKIAYLEKDIGIQLQNADSSIVQFTSYNINDFSMEVDAKGTNLLKMSEVYYPSGWRATIDDKETEIYKTDYAFRAIVVPPGKHTIRFMFEPITYKAGVISTAASNYLVSLVLLYYLVVYLISLVQKRKLVQRI